MYVDEVGNSDLDSSDDPNHRFLSLTGIIIDLEHVARVIHPQLEALKAEFFTSHPDEPIIFHRKEMVNYRKPFEAMSDENLRNRFDETLLGKLSEWQ